MPVDADIQKILDQHKDKIGAASGGGGDSGGSWNPFSTEEATTGAGAFGKGVIQGGLGFVEAPAQLAEWGLRKVTGDENLKLPGHDWASAYKRGVESSTAGNIGEMVGSVLPMFTPAGWVGAAGRGASLAARGLRGAEEIPSFLGAAGKGAEAIAKTGDRLLPDMAKGAAGAALSQPVSGDDLWHDKLQQMIAGAALGGVASRANRFLHTFDMGAEKAAQKAGFGSAKEYEQAVKDRMAGIKSQTEDLSSYMRMKNPPKWVKEKMRQKEQEGIGRKAWSAASHIGAHYLTHGLPISMFARWQAGRALGKLAEMAKMPGAPPQLRAAVEHIYRQMPYNPEALPFTFGAQANRWYPEERSDEEAQ